MYECACICQCVHVSMLYVYEYVHVCMLVYAVFANTIAGTSCEGRVIFDYDVWSALGSCCAPLSKSIFSLLSEHVLGK